MTARAASWAERALEPVRAAIGGASHGPWAHGLWVTWRERYDPVALARGFRVERLTLADRPRRVAFHPGAGRPVLILPGLYAELTERLFMTIAAEASLWGRPIVVLEDSLAAPTVALGAPGPGGLRDAGRAVDDVARWLGSAPDVLALSGGLIAAWTAGRQAVHHVVGFSGIVDLAAVVRQVRTRPLVERHFARCHARSGLPMAFRAWLERHEGAAPLSPPSGEWALVHAADDPVSPVASLASLPRERVCVLPAGGHLGFGQLAGPRVYLLPLEETHDG